VQIGSYSNAPIQRDAWSPILKRLPWSVTCLSATGRAFGHTKSRRLFSLLGGVERQAGIVVLPPRSTFSPTHSPRTPSRRQEVPGSGIPPAGRSTSCILTPIETERRCPGLGCNSVAFVHTLVIHSSVKLRSPPTRAKPG
jgi:hypothetical protein